MEVKENNKLSTLIEECVNNPYTKEVISITEPVLLQGNNRITVSEIQGDYPEDVIFTAMQQAEVTYINKYFGLQKAIIVAGFDAVRYRKVATNQYKGSMMSEWIKSVEFVGEYATTTDIIKVEK